MACRAVSRVLGSNLYRAAPQLPRINVFHRAFTSGAHQEIRRDWKPLAVAGATVLFSVVMVGYVAHIVSEREITNEELVAHKDDVWVAWKMNGKWYVSAMKDYVESHPGGSRILEAGGKAAMPFWQRFARHLDANGEPKPEVVAELKKRIVGVMKEAPPNAVVKDLWAMEPDRSGNETVTLQERPYNAGARRESLTDEITPLSKLFTRFHTPAPLIRSPKLRLMEGSQYLQFTVGDLAKLPEQTITAVIQCAGHRRVEWAGSNGVQWDSSVGNVNLRGYLLSDILKAWEMDTNETHYLLAQSVDEEGVEQFATAMPMSEIPAEAMVVTKVNGVDSRDHVGGLRLCMPGKRGFTQVKGLNVLRIFTRKEVAPERLAQFEDLGLWGPAVAMAPNMEPYVVKTEQGRKIDIDLSVNSLPQAPLSGLRVDKNATSVPLSGWAHSAGPIRSVDVSTDGGNTWLPCQLGEVLGPHAWRGWSIQVPIHATTENILVRATDEKGNTQPLQGHRNPRGVGNNDCPVVKLIRE